MAIIKLTGQHAGDEIHVDVGRTDCWTPHVAGTAIYRADRVFYVRETPDQIAALVQQARDDEVRDRFIAAALTGAFANGARGSGTLLGELVNAAVDAADIAMDIRSVTGARARAKE